MTSRTMLRTLSLAGLVALSTVACSTAGAPSGSTRLSSNAMCQAAGGTYAGGTCMPGGNPMTAQQMCATHNGVYVSGGDDCEFSSIWKP